MIAIVACSIIWYWGVQHIAHWVWGQFSEIMGISSSFTDSGRQSGPSGVEQIDDDDDDRWARALLGTISTLGGFAAEESASQ
jgi:hypothetical protein